MKQEPAGKIVAVSGAAKWESYLLSRVLSGCGREGYEVLPAESLPGSGKSAAVLLSPDPAARPDPAAFPVWVTRYLPEAKPDPAGFRNVVTYSVEWDGADFTARNLRSMPDGSAAFEVVGVGIIGRVRLKAGAALAEPALAAAAAAIAAGLPFADTLAALNCLDLPSPERYNEP